MSSGVKSVKGEIGVPKTVGAQLNLPNGAISSHPRMNRRGPNPPPSVPNHAPVKSSSAHRKRGVPAPLEAPYGRSHTKPPSAGRAEQSRQPSGGRSRPGSGRKDTPGSRPGSTKSYSARSTRSVVTVNEPDDEPEEQDVLFINIDSKNSSMEGTHDESLRVFERKTREISLKKVLISAQERDPEQVFEVSLHGAEIGRISNMEKFTKLRILDLSCNFIQKIEHLDKNVCLRELKLYDNEVQKIENIDHLGDLCHLQLQHNKIKTIGKGLNSQRKLKLLRLDNNIILKLDVRELAAVSQLTTLDLSNNKLDNVAAVNSLPNLEELFLVGNRLRVVSDLSRCRKLQEIDVSSNRLTDLSGLKQLPNLQILHASDNFLTSMKSLGKLKSLQELKIINNRISETKQFVDMFPNLQILDITDNHLEVWEDVCLLKNLPELVELFIMGNPFTLESGAKPMYHNDLAATVSQLEILDGASIQKKQTTAPGTPLMRPMSAASVISSRQVEAQLHSLTDELASFETSITSKFDSLRSLADQVCPSEVADTFSRASSAASSRPSSKCGKRSRIKEAQEYASQYS